MNYFFWTQCKYKRRSMKHGALTLWRPLVPGTLTLSPERQSARMSKITNDGLTRSGTECFICTHMATGLSTILLAQNSNINPRQQCLGRGVGGLLSDQQRRLRYLDTDAGKCKCRYVERITHHLSSMNQLKHISLWRHKSQANHHDGNYRLSVLSRKAVTIKEFICYATSLKSEFLLLLSMLSFGGLSVCLSRSCTVLKGSLHVRGAERCIGSSPR